MGTMTTSDPIRTQRVGDTDLVWERSGYDQEYAALRTSAGLVDLAGCSLLQVTGEDAVLVLQAALTRDIEFLTPERAMTAMALTPQGTPVDIVTVYAETDGYLVQTGPGRGPAFLAALDYANTGYDAVIVDRTEDYRIFSVEGPLAWRIVLGLLGEDYVSMAFESTLPATIEGTDALVARTGVTGEYGYTLLVPSAVAAQVWNALAGLATPVGHRALETAMLEVRQPVLHREAGAGDTVLSAGLNWLVDLSKDEFIGRDAVVAAWKAGGGDRPIGFTVTSGSVATGDVVLVGDEVVGRVRTVVFSPGAGTQLGLARVAPEWQATRLEFRSADGATLRTLAPPYVVPASWTTPILV